MATVAPPVEDFNKYRDEVERLKSFLLQLDAEINEDSVKTRQNIEELEANLAERDRIIRELQREEEPDFALTVEQLHSENEKLKEIIMRQEGTIEELTEKNDNLQSALIMLQSSKHGTCGYNDVDVQEEVSIGLLESRKEVLELEKRLAEKNVCNTDSVENKLAAKLSKDLDSRNCLIDQLNEEGAPYAVS
jgi:DNA repair exonuclease SbcCD ATPase subunit